MIDSRKNFTLKIQKKQERIINIFNSSENVEDNTKKHFKLFQ